MPELTVREVLTGIAVPNVEGNESVSMIQKRISMPEGKKFRIKSIQCFDDNGTIFTNERRAGGDQLTMRLIYVTPYPIVPSNEPWGSNTLQQSLTTVASGSMGPYAGDNTVLYKRLDMNQNPAGDENWNIEQIVTEEFPNPQSAQDNDYTWYTPHVYLTCMVWTKEGWAQDIKLSFSLKLEITNADSVQTAMGLYKENLEAQCRVLTDTANSIDPIVGAAGRSQPAWLYGGARPELMVTSANVLRYFNRLASAAYQDMDNITGFRTRYKESTTMVGFDKAFGDSATNIPDWIQLMDVAGVTSGAIRPYPPPTKFSGNGNTVMYDTNGLPASIVT